MQTEEIIRFTNCKKILEDNLVSEDLWVSGGKIIAPQKREDRTIDTKGMLIAAGYIDLQINGGYGVDFSRHPNHLDKVAAALLKHGVTSFLATVVSTSPEQYRKILPVLQKKNILGLHLEGPFLNPLYPGAHNKKYFCEAIGQDPLKECYGSLDKVRLVTLAPELGGAMKLIDALNVMGVRVSAGHSGATYEQTLPIITHLYNAMPLFHHRAPGLIGRCLGGEGISYSIIADGQHVHPAAIKMAWRANPQGLFLVSDAMSALGLFPGTYPLAGQEVTVTEEKACIAGTDILAGSIIALDEAVRRFQKYTGCTLVEAVRTATLKPAQILGISDTKGTLKIGADADFIILDENLYVQQCYRG